MKSEELYLRRATRADADLLFEWVNDKETRQNAFDTHIIIYEEHIAWFAGIIKDQNQAQYILADGEKSIGQIRLIIKDQEAEIDYSISKSERGYGYGKVIIGLIKEQIKKDYPDVQKIIGKVKPSNDVSCCCFLKNDFTETYRQFEYDIKNEGE